MQAKVSPDIVAVVLVVFVVAVRKERKDYLGGNF
jgi:hypothetical protein